MKRISLVIVLMMSALWTVAQTYQPMNGGFEQWDNSSVDAEPVHWNSFATSTGTYSSLASSPHHYHRSKNGNSYLTLYTKSILGVKANGNMTTGRIYAGSMTASSSNNYNYTERGNSSHCHPFTATPDSMYVWVSFYASSSSSQAQITTYVHGDCDFKDPVDASSASKYAAKAVARTTRTTSSASSMAWTQLKVPFEYTGTATPAYLLISMTTNMTPGGGSANDSLSVDNIEFVYSSWLTDIRVNGTTIEGFRKDLLEYDLGRWEDEDAFRIETTTEVSDASVAIDSTITIVDNSDDGGYDVQYEYHVVVTAEDGGTRQYILRRTLHYGEGEGGEDPPVAVPEVVAKRLSVVPNPTKGYFEILNGGQEMGYQLMNMAGKVVAEYAAGTRYVDISKLPSGVYILSQGGSVVRIIHGQ